MYYTMLLSPNQKDRWRRIVLDMPYRLWKPRISISRSLNRTSFAYGLTIFIYRSIGSARTAGVTPPIVFGIDITTSSGLDSIVHIVMKLVTRGYIKCNIFSERNRLPPPYPPNGLPFRRILNLISLFQVEFDSGN